MTEKYNVEWSKSVRIITIVVLLIIVGTEVTLIGLSPAIDWIVAILLFIIPITLGYFILLAPISIEIDESQLVLNRVLGQKIIRYDDIDSIEIYVSDALEVRLFGSGGFCGFVGTFRNKKIGKYQSYVGDYSQAFLIRTKEGKKYVLSCKNRESLISKINEVRHKV